MVFEWCYMIVENVIVMLFVCVSLIVDDFVMLGFNMVVWCV